jgi:predicted GNAT superfamily acetyltransferase
MASAALLALNNAHAVELSPLTADAFARLTGMAFHARQVGEADAFLIALDQDAGYDNPNFRWMHRRFERFVYVDRVVVAPEARGRGLAGALYADLFTAAEAAGHTRIVCEVNSDPPNPASDAFHARLGFAEVGAATLPGGAKTVRYLERRLQPPVRPRKVSS